MLKFSIKNLIENISSPTNEPSNETLLAASNSLKKNPDKLIVNKSILNRNNIDENLPKKKRTPRSFVSPTHSACYSNKKPNHDAQPQYQATTSSQMFLPTYPSSSSTSSSTSSCSSYSSNNLLDHQQPHQQHSNFFLNQQFLNTNFISSPHQPMNAAQLYQYHMLISNAAKVPSNVDPNGPTQYYEQFQHTPSKMFDRIFKSMPPAANPTINQFNSFLFGHLSQQYLMENQELLYRQQQQQQKQFFDSMHGFEMANKLEKQEVQICSKSAKKKDDFKEQQSKVVKRKNIKTTDEFITASSKSTKRQKTAATRNEEVLMDEFTKNCDKFSEISSTEEVTNMENQQMSEALITDLPSAIFNVVNEQDDLQTNNSSVSSSISSLVSTGNKSKSYPCTQCGKVSRVKTKV